MNEGELREAKIPALKLKKKIECESTQAIFFHFDFNTCWTNRLKLIAHYKKSIIIDNLKKGSNQFLSMFDISQFISIDYDQLCSIFIKCRKCQFCFVLIAEQIAGARVPFPVSQNFFSGSLFATAWSWVRYRLLTWHANTSVQELLKFN